MTENEVIVIEKGERGAALIMALLTLSLLLALSMGMSLTAISELGVTSTYSTQTVALQAAEAGLNHAASLLMNYQGKDFTELLADRTDWEDDGKYMTGKNPFVTANLEKERFVSGSLMIDEEVAGKGFRLREARIDPVTGLPAIVEDAYYRVSLIDDEPQSSSALTKVPNFVPTAGYWENDLDPTTDKNHRLVIYSTGTYRNASVTLEGWIAFLPYPAFSANDDINVSGNSIVNGIYGGIHSNKNLLISTGGGNNWWVEQTFTATGNIVGDPIGHVGGFYGGGQEELEIPPIVAILGASNPSPRIQNFIIQKADIVLIDPMLYDGAHETDPNGTGNNSSATARLRRLAQSLDLPYGRNDGSGSLVDALDVDLGSPHVQQENNKPVAFAVKVVAGKRVAEPIPDLTTIGWTYNSGTNAAWSIPPNADGLKAGGHTFYIVGMDNYTGNPATSTKNGGNVKLTGNVGSADPKDPLQVTILTTGSFEISGTPNISANLKDLKTPWLPPFVEINLLMVAVQDIKVTGDNNSAVYFTGVSFAGEQVELSSSGDLNGQVLALSNRHVPNTPVAANSISGRFNLTLNDGKAVGKVKLFSWRQIKR